MLWFGGRFFVFLIVRLVALFSLAAHGQVP
jgi:hypothetical protein